MKVKEESEKTGLKVNIQETKIMASGPITSWQIDGGKMETVTYFIFLGSKITKNGDCTHETENKTKQNKTNLLFGRKTMTHLDSIWNAETSLCQQKFIMSKLFLFLFFFFPQ